MRRTLFPLLLMLVAGAALAVPQDGLPVGPVWGRDTLPPEDANAAFATADGCANCHGGRRNAEVAVTAAGLEVSPHHSWHGTIMANSFRDPYFRAQLAREVELRQERKAEIEAFCYRCHAPMAHHTARLSGQPAAALEEIDADPLARDGVSCTLCHQIRPEGLGTAATFDGRPAVRPDRQLFGPYADPDGGSMLAHTAFRAVEGPHVGASAACGACHVLHTSHGAAPGLLEQATYLEWRNSEFTDEPLATATSQGCVQCHMAEVAALNVRRPATEFPFDVTVRPPRRSHGIFGGNAFILDLLRAHRDELGVTASAAALEQAAHATRAQLRHATARLAIDHFREQGKRLLFDVTVENLAGHKFPSGYPSRRAWLEVEVHDGRRVTFHSGAAEPGFGTLADVDDELALPHHDRIVRSGDVQVYEMVGLDAAGQPTTVLSEMVAVRKDNRLLPRGWRPDGPHGTETAPVGTAGDDDFIGGQDTVTYAVPQPRGTGVVVARLHYQPIAPAWADALFLSATPAADRFTGYYAQADPAPERVAVAAVRVP